MCIRVFAVACVAAVSRYNKEATSAANLDQTSTANRHSGDYDRLFFLTSTDVRHILGIMLQCFYSGKSFSSGKNRLLLMLFKFLWHTEAQDKPKTQM